MSGTVAEGQQEAEGNRWRVGLLALFVFTLFKSLIWAGTNPPLNAGDESAHLMYVMQLRNNGTLPVFKFAPDCSSGENTTPPEPSTLAYIEDRGYARLTDFAAQPYELYQPPLYYLSAALFASPVPADDPQANLYAARALSALLTAVTAFFFALALRELTGKPMLSLGVALLVASVPTFGFLGGVVNNDTMLNLFAAAILFVCLRLVQVPHMLVWGSLLLGALAGGALLTKASGIALIPAGLLAILFAAARALTMRQREEEQMPSIRTLVSPALWRRMALPLAVYTIGLTGIEGWLMIRHLAEYGDLLGTANHIRYGAECWGPPIVADGIGGLPRYLMSLALLTPYSFIASFGWGDEGVGANFYYAAILPFLILGAYGAVRRLRQNMSALSVAQRMGLIVLGTCVLVNVLIWISFNFTIQYQPTGRYLYMALLPIAGFFSIGLASLPDHRVRNILLAVVIAALHVLVIHGWLFAGTGWMATQAAGLAK